MAEYRDIFNEVVKEDSEFTLNKELCEEISRTLV